MTLYKVRLLLSAPWRSYIDPLPLSPDYEATLTITFDQGSDSTKVLFNLVGVPIGQEDVTTRNFQGK
jgi:hypothetical protein